MSLTDGFEHHLSASPEDYERVLKDGVVILDTNAILNLYRYTTEARKELFEVLRGLDERLWIPHQVATEFWRNRESAASDLDYFGNELIEELQETRRQMERSLRTWSNRVALQRDHLQTLLESLDSAFQPTLDKFQEIAGSRSEGKSRNTFEDPVLLELQTTLAGKVGEAMGEEEHKQAVSEGLRRVEEKIPPGYKDKSKGDQQAAGDYLVWAQTIKEARSRNCEALLITGDVKEDWWRKESGEIRGPRLELSKEFYSEVGCRVYMLRPPRFLELAREILNISVANETIDDASRVELSSYDIRERIDTASAVLASLRDDLLNYIKGGSRLPLDGDPIGLANDFPALIGLFHEDSLVYLAFASSTSRVLRRWHRKLSGRKNITPSDVSFVAAPVTEEQVNDRALMHGMLTEEQPEWNSNGFGNHDPGRLRVYRGLREDHFDLLYPIDISMKVSRLIGARNVGEAFESLRGYAPYRVHMSLRDLSEVADQEIDSGELNGTVENCLRILTESLPQGWQTTVMPGSIIIEPLLKDVPNAQLILRGGLINEADGTGSPNKFFGDL
ncbi:PIN-like domain-containing protein [Streptomyces sp. SP18ES09]|uniref:PIN-like domain-containing protein n=1 Tax=Streptomyces sp. SP18ES09 TaxID=3002532 RepID=UPI002E765DBC|nr:PIN-like domain-containing protein [Streptomyces sp. SP18ES09]MEE1818306.1 PIN-like domain-containing protein [Streptomyces sp. SP18ES09]